MARCQLWGGRVGGRVGRSIARRVHPIRTTLALLAFLPLNLRMPCSLCLQERPGASAGQLLPHHPRRPARLLPLLCTAHGGWVGGCGCGRECDWVCGGWLSSFGLTCMCSTHVRLPPTNAAHPTALLHPQSCIASWEQSPACLPLHTPPVASSALPPPAPLPPFRAASRPGSRCPPLAGRPSGSASPSEKRLGGACLRVRRV